MASICLKIEGKPGEISVYSLLTGVQNQLHMLENLDAAISRSQKGTLDWVVTDLGVASITVTMQSRSRVDDRNMGPEVARAYVAGLGEIEHDGVTPPYFTPEAMQSARKMLKVIGHNGATGISVSTRTVAEPVHLSAVAAVNIEQLLPTRYQSLGSVEGNIEMVSIHGKPRFIVYHARTRKAVECRFDADRWLAKVKDALGFRVNVSGMVHWNAKGEPMRVDIDHIRVLRTKAELPKAATLTGSQPDLTGGLETVEYLRRLRLG